MHGIHRYKIILLVGLLVGCFLTSDAQVRPKGNYNFWDYQQKPFYFGLTLGMHSTGYLTTKSRQFVQEDSIFTVAGADKPGLHVNIITNLKIGQYFDFRIIPGFAFSERRLIYDRIDLDTKLPVQTFEKVESVFLELPLLLRFKSEPYKDKRLFVVSGLKYSYDVATNSRLREENLSKFIQISPHDFQFEIGVGMQMFFPFFIFSPEIKFSHGIGNIHILNNSKVESTVIDKITSRALTISFHFEG